MTLIVGIKCDDGYVVCADSQETVPLVDGTQARVTCQKLVSIPVGKVTISIAGSGDANLIDAFVERIRVGYAASEISSLAACRAVIQEEIAAFKKEKRPRRTGLQDPFSFLIGAQSQQDRRCVLWRTAAGDLIEVKRYALVGYEDTRYDYAARNLFRVALPNEIETTKRPDGRTGYRLLASAILCVLRSVNRVGAVNTQGLAYYGRMRPLTSCAGRSRS
jgi:hypothetical protein